jgi:hypothetical protein
MLAWLPKSERRPRATGLTRGRRSLEKPSRYTAWCSDMLEPVGNDSPESTHFSKPYQVILSMTKAPSFTLAAPVRANPKRPLWPEGRLFASAKGGLSVLP